MRDTALRRDADNAVRLWDYARGLGVTDRRAVAAAQGRYRHLVEGGQGGRAFDGACALLRSWCRHPSNRTA